MCFQVLATEKACVLQAFFLSGLFLTGKFFAEQFIDLCRIGFAASRLTIYIRYDSTGFGEALKAGTKAGKCPGFTRKTSSPSEARSFEYL